MAVGADVTEERELQRRLERVEELVGELEQLPDPSARASVAELLGTVLELHRAALARLLDLIGEPERGGGTAIDRLAADELVRHVLLLHDLHPVDLRTRVERALDSVRPYMSSHGGGVELLEVTAGAVRIRLIGHCQGCPSSTMTLKLAVEKAIHEAAPDVGVIEVAGDSPAKPSPPGVPTLRALPLISAGMQNGAGAPVATRPAQG